jgi:hypothetical protein
VTDDEDGAEEEGAVVVETVVVTTVVESGVVVTTLDSTTTPPPGPLCIAGGAGVVTDISFESGLAPTDVSARKRTPYVVDGATSLISNGDVIEPAGSATQVVPPSTEYS